MPDKILLSGKLRNIVERNVKERMNERSEIDSILDYNIKSFNPVQSFLYTMINNLKKKIILFDKMNK